MTDEEKEAIDYLELHSAFNVKLDKGNCIRITEENFTKTKLAIETVLNLIQTKQEEIERIIREKEIHIKLEHQYKKEYLDAKEEIKRYKMQLAEIFANTVNSNLEIKHKYEEQLEALNLGWKQELEEKTQRIENLEKECQKYHDAIMELIDEKNQKNLIIVEMAKFIEVFELDSEIAKTYCGETVKKCKHINEDGCLSCIIDYFKKEVEKGDEDDN